MVATIAGPLNSSEWVIERRGLAHLEPWCQLPRTIRPKAKLPGFLRAGWQILEMIRERGLEEFSWLVQDNHVVSSARCAHTYIYSHDQGRNGRKRPAPGGLTITTEGGGHFWTENGASGAAPPGTEGVFACSARDAQGELLLGKCFRRARLIRPVSDRSVKKADVEYEDTYSFLHLGVRELTEQRAFGQAAADNRLYAAQRGPAPPPLPRGHTPLVPAQPVVQPVLVEAQPVPAAAAAVYAAAAADALWPQLQPGAAAPMPPPLPAAAIGPPPPQRQKTRPSSDEHVHATHCSTCNGCASCSADAGTVAASLVASAGAQSATAVSASGAVSVDVVGCVHADGPNACRVLSDSEAADLEQLRLSVDGLEAAVAELRAQVLPPMTDECLQLRS